MELIKTMYFFICDIFMAVTKKAIEFLMALAGFFLITIEVGIVNPVREVMYWLNKNIYILITLSMVVMPFAYLVQAAARQEDIIRYALGMFMLWVLKRIVEETGGTSNNIPIPRERFTKQEADGGYSIEKDRLQEMILYVADVEEYLERTGKSKCKQRTSQKQQ